MKTWIPLKKRAHFLLFCAVLFVLTVFAAVAATLLGSVAIDSGWIGKIVVNKVMGSAVFAQEWPGSVESIIWTLRLPRVFLAFLAGAGLSLCGLLMQALTKNSLADPYVLGISSGASAGAVAVIMYGWFAFAGAYRVMAGATFGAALAIVIAMKAAAVGGKITSAQLVLAGIAVSALFTSCTNVMIYHTQTGSDKVKSAMYWMIGSLSGATWEKMGYVALLFLLCLAVICFFHRSLDVLLLGDEAALTLGVNLRAAKLGIIAVCTVLTGVIVSVSGVVGFVGLVIPHIVRCVAGSRHIRLIPASVLAGGLFLIVCDMASRLIVSPEELPIGVVTAFVGAPFFLFLIRKNTTSFGGRNG